MKDIKMQFIYYSLKIATGFVGAKKTQI